ncbi:phage tail protein [Paenibacillus sp. 481]|uniref:phage tail protein n=1 Tax=Paenibacillus sp. 481 TaxID=2835869 RepID=UPI001E57961E|nr:phage tail protein [Paenibacillus sp. 481]UHA73460.1 hypothetical protein KIK04_23360 [Paenibacillus sp. 481]
MNGAPRFFSFNKKSDWDKGQAENVTTSDEGICISQTQTYMSSKSIRVADYLGSNRIVDIALSRYGKLYLLTHRAELWLFDPWNGTTEAVFEGDHGLFTATALIAGSDRFVYIFDPTRPHKCAAYSVYNGQAVWQLEEWDELPLYPLAVAADKQDNVYVIVPLQITEMSNGDIYVPQGGEIGVVKIDASGRPDPSFRQSFTVVATLTSLADLARNFYMAVEHQHVHILDTRTGQVHTLTENSKISLSISMLEGALDSSESVCSFAVADIGRLFVGYCRRNDRVAEYDGIVGTIQSFDVSGNVATLTSSLQGHADKILFDDHKRMYVLNRSANELNIRQQSWRTKPINESGSLRGVYYSNAIDSTIEGTNWHKLLLEADIPIETEVRVSSYASDKAMTRAEWIEREQQGLLTMSEPIVNPADALLFKQTGRFLWLKIEMSGSENSTPLLKKLRVYFPRTSLLSYLPAIYEEETGDGPFGPFLERFLAMFDTVLMEKETTIQHMARFFDADAVSGEFLRWIGTWVGISDEHHWAEEQLRSFISQSPDLYARRGTRSGMERMISIFTGEKPIIIEHFQLQAMQEHTELKSLYVRLYGDNPYSFFVLLTPEAMKSDHTQHVIEKVLADHKPAFTEAHVVVLEPWMYMDMHTYLGINTVLTEPHRLVLNEQSSIPHDTVLTEWDRDNRLDMHIRLDIDAELE